VGPRREALGALTACLRGWHVQRVSDQSYPVTVLVRRPDGSKEAVRVGTAVRSGDGFNLVMGELSIGAVPDAVPSPARRASSAPGSDTGMVFPPYGRSKGLPVAGAAVSDLEFYKNGCERTLGDPAKARWHDKERVLLAAIEAELARQRGDAGSSNHDEEGYGGSAPADDDRPPPHSDDDIPF
jgi:hypothetical protein